MKKLLFMLVPLMSNAEADSFDVVVVQATPGGIAAAVAAAEEGLDVALLESSSHIGGLAAGGLSNTDFISFQSLGGTWRDFMDRVVSYYAERYGENSQQVKDCRGGGWYEPKVAENVFQEMLGDAGVTLLKQHRLLSAETLAGGERSQMVSVTAEDLERPGGPPRRIEAKVFIDASYAGDLIAAAGASYELQNVQAFNYRVVMSRDPANQVPFADVRPNHYEELEFEGVRSWLLNEEPEMDLDRLFKIRKMPNNKAEWNDVDRRKYHFSIPGDGWARSRPAYRRQMEELGRIVAQGLFYFLATDPALAQHPVQEQIRNWGYAADEFEDNGHFPHALYVREGRRLHGDYVMGSHDVQQDANSSRAPFHPDSVAIGDYPSSYHSNWNDYGLSAEHLGSAKGDFRTTGRVFGQTRPDPGEPDRSRYPRVTTWGGGIPFCLPYGCMVPVDVDQLLAPVPCSAERSAFVRLRMEPTWTALGQAAGLAAAQAIKKDIHVRDINVSQLQQALHRAGAITYYFSDVQPGDPIFEAVQFLGTHGLLHDSSILSSSNHYPAPYSTQDAQWRDAFKWHDAQPQLILTQQVADHLAKQFTTIFANATLPEEALLVDGKRTRGEAYASLYRAVQTERAQAVTRD